MVQGFRATPAAMAGVMRMLQDATMRMQLRRLTRLTNGFSKKWENLRAALALHFWNYNFCWMHSTIRMTPAMKAGVARKPMSIADLVAA